MKKYLIEFVGTFFLVLIIGLSENPVAIGVGLSVLVYMGAHISGAHYNPAVSLAMFIKKDLDKNEFVIYIISQILGATFASIILSLLSVNMQVQPNLGESIFSVFASEILFTYLLVFVILNVACHPAIKDNSFYGIAIGLTVMTGAFCVGPISGGVFNPAVSIGPSIFDLINGSGSSFSFTWYYILAPSIGSVLAFFHFNYFK